jgi:hypothetical protein
MGGERELKEGPKKKEALGFAGVRKCLGEGVFHGTRLRLYGDTKHHPFVLPRKSPDFLS